MGRENIAKVYPTWQHGEELFYVRLVSNSEGPIVVAEDMPSMARFALWDVFYPRPFDQIAEAS